MEMEMMNGYWMHCVYVDSPPSHIVLTWMNSVNEWMKNGMAIDIDVAVISISHCFTSTLTPLNIAVDWKAPRHVCMRTFENVTRTNSVKMTVVDTHFHMNCVWWSHTVLTMLTVQPIIVCLLNRANLQSSGMIMSRERGKWFESCVGQFSEFFFLLSHNYRSIGFMESKSRSPVS